MTEQNPRHFIRSRDLAIRARDLTIGVLSLICLLSVIRLNSSSRGPAPSPTDSWQVFDSVNSSVDKSADESAGSSADKSALIHAGFAGGFATLFAGLPGGLQQTLGDGEYVFLPHRHSVWVINRRNGRFANFTIRDIAKREVKITRRTTLDQGLFPPAETIFLLSDHNLTDVLWVCNKRTGVTELYEPQIEGAVSLQGGARPQLGEGEHIFLPHRRTVWIVNRTNGAFVSFHFKDTQEKEVVSSQVARVDSRDFPPADCTYQLSSKNFGEVLWVCNKRTGDVQFWYPKGGILASLPHLATSTSLMK